MENGDTDSVVREGLTDEMRLKLRLKGCDKVNLFRTWRTLNSISGRMKNMYYVPKLRGKLD